VVEINGPDEMTKSHIKSTLSSLPISSRGGRRRINGTNTQAKEGKKENHGSDDSGLAVTLIDIGLGLAHLPPSCG
jgi:hypothetical protein